MLLNNDTTVHSDLLEELVSASNQENADVISPKIYFTPGKEFHQDRYKPHERGKVIWYAGGLIDWNNVLTSHRGVDEVDEGQFDEFSRTEFVTGCAMFVKYKVFEDIGLLDPMLFAYFEDADFSMRAKNAGYKVAYAPKAVLWHKNAASFQGSGSEFQDYFVTKNRLHFGLRYAPLRAKIALLREGLRYIFEGPQRKREAIIDALLRKSPDQNKVTSLLKT